jgi:tRNA(Ile)-lysidine synthase
VTPQERRELYLERFLADLSRLGLPGEARGILVAVSGGPDSTALARLFAAAAGRARGSARWPPLWLGHVHHAIRGAEADRDLEFCLELARALGFSPLSRRIDVPGLARSRKLSLEAAARAARYQLFSEWTQNHPIDAIALAHTGSDQAETVLLRLFRRAGLRGLSGMAERRPLGRGQPGVYPLVVRPLLEWRREEVLDLLDALGQPYQEDSTNRDPSILRNRVRHRLLPLLRSEFEPAIDRALVEIARMQRSVREDLETLARQALEEAAGGRGEGSLVLEAGLLARLPRTLRRVAVELAAEALRGPAGSDAEAHPSARRLTRLSLWLEEPPGDRRVLELGAGLRAELQAGRLLLSARSGPGTASPPPAHLPVPGAARWGAWEIRAEELFPPAAEPFRPEPPSAGGSEPELREVVDRESLSGPLLVRGRLPGDRLSPLGLPGSKKLKELLRERGVRPRDRGAVPLVADSRGIVWVVGHRIGHPHRLREETRSVLRLTARRLPEGAPPGEETR